MKALVIKIYIMKKVIFLIVVNFIFIGCIAQSPILPLDDLGWKNTNEAYYKDMNDELDDFEGTWLYTNGNTSLKITLVKYQQIFNGKYYEDIIIGGYQYIKNGIEKVNTLSDANNPNLGISASIVGNNIHTDCRYLPVDDCSTNEKSLDLGIDDPNSDKHWGVLRVFRRTVNGQEAIKINISMTYVTGEDPEDGDFPPPSIPWDMNNIVLIKQN